MRILELFAGIGACSKALERLGKNIEIVDAVEIDKYAIKSFNAVHGTNFEPQDITKWDKDLKDIDIITHGSPCFLAGEKVNTKDGFKNIENIKIGDYVKSHDGEYNKVIEIMKNKNNYIFDVSCSATHNINTTFNHPFYILRNNKKEWIEAKDLTTKDFMCIPINNRENEIEYTTNLPIKSIRFWYLIGRFIGDGWVTRRKERNNNISGIKICCAKNELDDLKSKLCNILNYCVIEDRTTYKLQFSNKELGEFCEQFGIGAKNKHIPQWVLDLKKEYLEYLLMGIIDSDGCYSQNKYKVTTISRDLAYNIGELVLKTKGVPYHIYKTIRPKKYKIENRIVNQNNTYQITWGYEYNKNINFVDGNYLYSRIRKINKRSEDNYVYNIEVENTHSYCVNNIAVHNCQDFSVAGKQAGGDIGSGTRSSLMYETIRIVGKIRPKYVLWENVKNLLSKSHKHNFDAYIQTMNSLGYTSYYQVLNAKDYGIPQNRERVFTISIRNDINKKFEFPKTQELKIKIKDILEEKVDEKYYLTSEKIMKIANWKAYQKPFEKVLGKNSIAPTLTARGAGEEHSGMITISEQLNETTNLQEKIICEQRTDEGLRFFKNNVCGSLRTIDSCGDKRVIETNLKTQLCNKLIENCIVKGGEIINHSYTNSEQRNTLDKYIESDNGIMPTLTTRPDILGYVEKSLDYLTIRKLTPKECWRLMGFDDKDFEKAESIGISNAQLYKQAGNSIVVNVLEKIFDNLLK